MGTLVVKGLIEKELPEVYINPLTSKSTDWFLYDGNIGG